MSADMTLFQKKRKIPVVTVIAFLLVFAVGIYAAFAEDAVVTDMNLKNALIAIGADTNTDGEISSAEMEALTVDLTLSNLNISNISGLEFAVNVPNIYLQNNTIRSLQPLVTLVGKTPALTNVDISQNYLIIADGSEDKLAIDAIALGCTVINTSQTPIPVNSVTLSSKPAFMGIGETATLTAAVAPDDAANKDLVWVSDNLSVATVSNGTVTAVALGKANITVSSASNPAVIDTFQVTVKSYAIESTKYPIDRAHGIIKGVPKATTSDNFLSNLRSESSDLSIYDAAGNLCAQTALKTGMTVRLNVGGTQRDTLKIAVSGDGNGDGSITVSDYTLTRLDILGLKGLDDISKAACDINGDGKVSISDYTTLRLDILGLKAISPLPDLPAVSDPRIRAFLDVALMQQGKPYIWSNEGPDSFDCSGYIYYCLRKIGYSVGRSTASTYSGKADWLYIPRDQLQPGDLMFYFDDDMATIGHIGIYLGNGYHVHASSSYGCVIICRVEDWYDNRLSHGRRVFY
jgi:hypothetical protein